MAEQVAFLTQPTAIRPIRLRHPAWLILLAAPLFGLGLFFLPSLSGFAALGAGLSIALVAAGVAAFDALQLRSAQVALRGAATLLENDPAPSLFVDANGLVVAQNAASEAKLGTCVGAYAATALEGVLVNPAASVQRMEREMVSVGHAIETEFARTGHVRLTTHKAKRGTVWRIEEIGSDNQSMGEAITLPMLVAGQNGTILSVNSAMRELLGFRPAKLKNAFGDADIQDGARVPLRSIDGTIMASLVITGSEDGLREIYAHAIGNDGIDMASQEALFEAMPVPALLVRADGELHAYNDAARQLLRIEPDEACLKIGDVIDGPGRLAREWMRDILDDRAPNRSEIVSMLRGGDERSIKITVTPLPGRSEPRLLAVLQDATEVQDLQAQFAQSQKMQAIGELAGGVAHDFNNLLTAITGHCDLLLLRHDQGDQDFADLVQIHQNANRAASLVGQLLAFSRKQNMKPELLDLRDTMADLTHLLNRLVGERVTLELSQDQNLQPIWADRRLLDQVLMNLVVNARDAMPSGGPIRITSRMARLEEGMKRNNAHVPPGTYVIIEVSDEGIGIPEDRLGRIFEPFFTTKRVGEGTGLGLSMAYGIVKQSGGFIFCDSVRGEGTTFSLLFPAHDWPSALGDRTTNGASDASATTRQVASDRNTSGVILLVEDEAPVRAFASRALRLKGYSVLEAENGEEALEVLEDDELEIDVFVTDMIMPGKGGPDWVREALVARPDVGVVFTSGYAEDAYGKFPDIPQAVFLAKPFSLAELTETVQREMP